jgi:hypothetical protein
VFQGIDWEELLFLVVSWIPLVLLVLLVALVALVDVVPFILGAVVFVGTLCECLVESAIDWFKSPAVTRGRGRVGCACARPCERTRARSSTRDCRG